MEFNRGVIDTLIDRQRDAFNEAGVPEDVLDRLKALWNKNLQEEQANNVRTALDYAMKQNHE